MNERRRMGYIKNIVGYFYHHQFSNEMVEKVQSRLTATHHEKEKDEALLSVWNDIGFPKMSSEALNHAYSSVEQRAGLKDSSSFNYSYWLKLAAIWTLPFLLLCASLYLYHKSSVRENTIARITFVEHYASAGKHGIVTLPDGSRVWLNSGTLLIHPSMFVGQERQVYISGEGYFDVKKNPEMPFVVRTNVLQIKVLGTKFDLSAYPEAEKVTTTLEQGAVSVLLNQRSTKGKNFSLSPNEQLVYKPSTGEVEKLSVIAANYSDWKEGGLNFSSSSFHDIMMTLERVYNIKVHVQTSVYNENRLTIHFNKNESIENVMMLIKAMVPGLEYHVDGRDIYIQ